MQGAAAPENNVADVPKASCTSLPPRPKWLSYPRMYRNSNKKATSQRTKGRPGRRGGPAAMVSNPGSFAGTGSTPKTSLNHFLHSSLTPKTSESSPSIPSSIQCSHSVEDPAGIPFQLQTIIVESDYGDTDEVDDLETGGHESVATPKARRAEPLKAIRNAFSRLKGEDGFESESEDRPQRRPSVGSSGSQKSNKSAGSWRRRFLLTKPGSKRNLVKKASVTDQVSLALV